MSDEHIIQFPRCRPEGGISGFPKHKWQAKGQHMHKPPFVLCWRCQQEKACGCSLCWETTWSKKRPRTQVVPVSRIGAHPAKSLRAADYVKEEP